MNPDLYYKRSEVSNSDLTTLKYMIHPTLNFLSDAARQNAFHLGTLVDALVTEPKNVNHYRRTVNDEQYTKEEWEWGKKMLKAIRKAATRDPFLTFVLDKAETQRYFVNPEQHFEYGCFKFSLPTRCKWDWWLGTFGGDLKTVSAKSPSDFMRSVDFFDWDRSRAWYMDLVHSLNPAWGNQDFIYGISKQNFKVFSMKIKRDDEVYKRGKSKYLELAFRMWMIR